MADEVARRREIRKRKILESSEARIKKIFNVNTSQPPENLSRGENADANNRNNEKINKSNSNLIDDDFQIGDYEFSSREEDTYESQSSKCTNRLKACDTQPSSSNGDFSRSPSLDNYIFPKKVSDAETRSFGRTRSDVRRNSSCTQIMMETLQFSSFSLKLLRLLLAVTVAFIMKVYFLLSKSVAIFNTILIPYVMLEVVLYSWSKFEPQLCSRPMASSIMSGVFLICGFPSTVVSSLNSAWNICQSLTIDICVYLFSFVIFHLVFETCM